MPRKPREELAGGLHHVFARGNDRKRIFVDDVDRRRYVDLLRTVIGRMGWRCLTYCLMPNHVHLLVETPRPNLGAGMHQVHGLYARAFNRRHRRSGHLFGGRYGSVRIEDDAQLWMTVGYIVRNPVVAGLCAAPDEWEWSGHPAAATSALDGWIDVALLYEYLAALGGDPRQRYAECVAGGRTGDSAVSAPPRAPSAVPSPCR